MLHFTGDGGNDVSMIQAANVGVGIVGKVCIDSLYLKLQRVINSNILLME